MIRLLQTVVLLAVLHGRPSPVPTGLVAALHAALHGFNTQDCAQIYDNTAPWMRGHASRADTIAACRQNFVAGHQNGVTLLRLTTDGVGHAMSTHAYRQPLLLRRALFGRTITTRETMQLVQVRARWYVLALW
jgi:hypothetical protein